MNAKLECGLRNLYGRFARHRKADEEKQGRSVLLFDSYVEKPQYAVWPTLRQCGQ